MKTAMQAGNSPWHDCMQWIASAGAWLGAHAQTIALVEFGVLIIGHVAALWGWITMRSSHRELLQAIGQLLDMMQDMAGKPEPEQRRILGKKRRAYQ